MRKKKILAFGDIHGEWEKLRSVWQQVQPDLECDEIIFLGDYIDRGPDTPSVLAFLMPLAVRDNVHLLRGNHEQMMLDAYRACREDAVDDNGQDMIIWKENGGDSTQMQILEAGMALSDVLAFVQERPYFYTEEIDGAPYFFCHAGIDPLRPIEAQDPDDLLWIRDDYIWGYDGETTIVTGHTPTCFLGGFFCYSPVIQGHQIFLDTGSYMPDGHVSCMDMVTREVWQSQC